MAWRPLRNFWLKVAALGLGALLWFTVTGERVERKIPRVPIVYSNIPPSLLITDQPDSVDVSVRGSYDDISRMQDITINADLSEATSGLFVLFLRPDQVIVPSGVEVMQIDPNVINVYLEQSDEREVPIDVRIEGEPASGFVRGEVTVEPATVMIVGPQSRLSPATRAVTQQISIDGASETITRSVFVGAEDAQLQLAEPGFVATVTVVIERESVTRTIDVMSVAFPNLAAGLEVIDPPESVEVTIRGPSPDLASLDVSVLTAQVDVAGLGPGRHTRDVVVPLPPGFEVEQVPELSVALRIR